jgi:DNA-binding NarL/FixJ family response regulator
VTTVVVVDDHAGFRTMVRAMLIDGGFQVVGEATAGAAALAVVAGVTPDVVLLDVHLPDMDGFAVSRALRSGGVTAKIVLCSVRPATDYGSRTGSCGADGFLPKADLTADTLRTLLRAR